MITDPINMFPVRAGPDTSYSAHRPGGQHPYENMPSNSDLGVHQPPPYAKQPSHSRSSSNSSEPDDRRSRVAFTSPEATGFIGSAPKNQAHISSYATDPECQDIGDAKGTKFRWIYTTRIWFRVFVLIASLALFGVLVHVLATYQKTKDRTAMNKDTGLEFHLWHKDTNLVPSNILLGAASVCAGLSIGILIGSVNKTMRRLTKVGNITTLCLSIACCLLFALATAYFKLWDRSDTVASKRHNWKDIWSWTCDKQDNKLYQDELDFEGLCLEMRFSWRAALFITIMELFAVLTCAYGVYAGSGRYREVAAGQEGGVTEEGQKKKKKGGDKWYDHLL